MLALILLTVFLHLNQICNGQSIEGKPEEEVLELATDPTGQIASTKGLITQPKIREDQVDDPQDIDYGLREDVGDHWPLGVIPYYFDPESYDQLIAIRFRDALNSVEASSCVKFKQLQAKPNDGLITWLHVTNPDGQRACVHELAFNTTSGEIQVLLGWDCLKRREVLHTLLHAIGLKDEVGHSQRDHYIRIMWENIQHEYRKLFRVQLYGDIITEYDPASIMHFHDRAFTLNGQATIAPLMSGLFINPSNDLSPLDKMKLRLLFSRECNRRKVGNLLDTCKDVLHTQYQQDGKDEQYPDLTKVNEEDRPADKQDPANVPCSAGKLGCTPVTPRDEDSVADEVSDADKVPAGDQFTDSDEVALGAGLNAYDNKPSAEVVELLD